jgi:hypothetical protein
MYMHVGLSARSTVRNDLCYIPTKRRALAASPFSIASTVVHFYACSGVSPSSFFSPFPSPLPLSFLNFPPVPRRLSFLLRFTSSFSRFYCGEVHLCPSFPSLLHVLVATSHSINLPGFYALPENQSPPTQSLIYQR